MYIHIQIKTVVWRFFSPQSLILLDKNRECLCGFPVLQIHSSHWSEFPFSHLFCESLCPRKAVFEMYHLGAALHYPAAQLFTHKLDTYFICSFHRFKLSKDQMVFFTTQVILMNWLPLSTAASLGSCLHWVKDKASLLHQWRWTSCSCVLLKLKEVKMRLIFQWARSTNRECRDDSSQTTLF